MLTKYTELELRTEIELRIEECHARGDVVQPRWITHQICREHAKGLAVNADQTDEQEPDDVAFWRFCGYTLTRKLTTDCINDLSKPNGSRSHVAPFLPGFQHLQRHYVITRDGEDVEVPTGQLTVDELLEKADQYDRNAGTLVEHARELRRYAAMRAHEASA
jgi:hypothetical protein